MFFKKYRALEQQVKKLQEDMALLKDNKNAELQLNKIKEEEIAKQLTEQTGKQYVPVGGGMFIPLSEKQRIDEYYKDNKESFEEVKDQ